jgi:hypothetical protein
VHVVSIELVTSHRGSASFQSNDVMGAAYSFFDFKRKSDEAECSQIFRAIAIEDANTDLAALSNVCEGSALNEFWSQKRAPRGIKRVCRLFWPSDVLPESEIVSRCRKEIRRPSALLFNQVAQELPRSGKTSNCAQSTHLVRRPFEFGDWKGMLSLGRRCEPLGPGKDLNDLELVRKVLLKGREGETKGSWATGPREAID